MKKLLLTLSALHWKGNMFFGTSFTARAAGYLAAAIFSRMEATAAEMLAKS